METIRIHPGIVLLAGCLACAATGQEDAIVPLLEVSGSAAADGRARVTAVYGISADDYLPVTELARRHLRPNVRPAASRPAFDLPDACYFVGGPIFLLILLRVLVIFLNGFEEKRKEEQRRVASEEPRRE